jgi:hypothetical protein
MRLALPLLLLLSNQIDLRRERRMLDLLKPLKRRKSLGTPASCHLTHMLACPQPS